MSPWSPAPISPPSRMTPRLMSGDWPWIVRKIAAVFTSKPNSGEV